ncbi:MAG: thiamine phosphate synthase [Eubacteriales bacterium]
MKTQFDASLYLVTDRTGLSDDDFFEKVNNALRGGVTLVQLREKNCGGGEFLALALRLREITSAYGVPLIIDDRADIAIACAADGVHIGASDIPVAAARSVMGKDKIVGATAKTVEAAIKAAADGADYLGVGAIFKTTTKVKTVLTSVETLRDIISAVTIPVVAIGGLNDSNCDILRGSGIAGAAVVSAIMKAVDSESAARSLRTHIERIKSEKCL